MGTLGVYEPARLDDQMTALPLASVIVVSFNQEPFVRAAVRSAFAQTYSPLEIILSDDCSQDRTFEIMQEEAQAYKGPHKVILNRNPTNLGVAQHYNRAAGLASGEIVIVQDGDDISAPERTAKVARAFNEPTPVDMVCSDVVMIDKDGQPLPPRERAPVSPLTLSEAVAMGSISAAGCACAYSKSLWLKYGPMDAEVLQEDVVLPFRALLERGIRVLDEPLVEYRIHDSNLFAFQPAARRTRTRAEWRRWARSWWAISRDWSQGWSASGRKDAGLERLLQRHLLARAYDAKCYDRSPLYAVWAALIGLAQGLTPRNAAGIVRRHVLRIP